MLAGFLYSPVLFAGFSYYIAVLPMKRSKEKATDSPLDILHRYWGYPDFRPLQEEIIRSVLAGKDTLALLPTGGGKSICFQVPALMMEGLCLVVTPLISLMKDQAARLNGLGIPALALHAGFSFREVEAALRKAAHGELKFLYLSPERLQTDMFRTYLTDMPVCLLAVDEAHCISQWGYDFRPAYLRIADIREELPGVPVLAITATATRKVRTDIMERLHFSSSAVQFTGSFVRENISFSVLKVENKLARLEEILQKVKGSSIVFCRSRLRCEQIATHLQELCMSAGFYHAGMDAVSRNERQEQWLKNELRIMVCTNAFGMGIDKPDVRSVIHYDVPDSLEAYYQEAGRAGRDGKRSYAVLLHQPKDAGDMEKRTAQQFPTLETIRNVYAAIVNYLQVPAGSGEGRYYDMDITDFSKRFRIPVSLVFHTLRILEQEGILMLSESIFLQARVCFTTTKEALYEFEKVQPSLEPLVKALLRSYEGIFDHFAAVSEKQLARMTRKKEAEVISALELMQRYGLLNYEPRKDSPQLYFMQERVVAKDLFIDMKRLQLLKDAYLERVAAMQAFVLDTETCRMQQIVRYFDEGAVQLCGICDVCLQKKEARSLKQTEDKYLDDIQSLLRGSPMPVEALLQHFPRADHEMILQLLRFCLDEKILILNKTQVLELRKK